MRAADLMDNEAALFPVLPTSQCRLCRMTFKIGNPHGPAPFMRCREAGCGRRFFAGAPGARESPGMTVADYRDFIGGR